MLHIEKGTSTNIYPTFTELMIDPENWILIKLESEMLKDKDVQYFLLKDNISLQRGRFDAFTITETSDDGIIDPEEAIISIPLTGFYEYTAYEYDRTITSFDSSNPEFVKLVETGRINVTGTDDDITIDEVYK